MKAETEIVVTRSPEAIIIRIQRGVRFESILLDDDQALELAGAIRDAVQESVRKTEEKITQRVKALRNGKKMKTETREVCENYAEKCEVYLEFGVREIVPEGSPGNYRLTFVDGTIVWIDKRWIWMLLFLGLPEEKVTWK